MQYSVCIHRINPECQSRCSFTTKVLLFSHFVEEICILTNPTMGICSMRGNSRWCSFFPHFYVVRVQSRLFLIMHNLYDVLPFMKKIPKYFRDIHYQNSLYNFDDHSLKSLQNHRIHDSQLNSLGVWHIDFYRKVHIKAVREKIRLI